MSSFLSRVKSQFSSSSSSSSSSKKHSSLSSSAPPSSSPSTIKASPSSTFSRQGTITRKAVPLSSSTSSSNLNGSAVPRLQLHLDEREGGGLGTLAEGGLLEEDATAALRVKEIEILGTLSWTSDQVTEFVALCAKKMKERDMSTPGLFLPHRLPSSLTTQQTLLLLFLRVKQPGIFPPAPPTSSLTLTPPTPAYLFETELKYTALVHDLASVIRFSIRHLSPSKERAEWYTSFATWEVERGFEPNVWVQIGGMNEEVRELMVVVEELLMGVAALVDRTGVSAARLTRLLGFWILRDGTEISGDSGEVVDLVRVFERLGRRMEHATLAYIRYQSQLGQIPTRLLPLIEGYPFRSNEEQHHYSATPLLGTPPSTTRPRSVLHVKIRGSTFPKTSRKPDPVYLAEQAFRANLSRGAKDSQEASQWEMIRGRVQLSNDDAKLDLGEVFDSETVRTISIIGDLYPSRPSKPAAPPPSEPMYRPFQANGSNDQLSSMRSLGRPSHQRKRSMSHSDVLSSVEEVAPSSTSPSSPFSEFGMKSASHLTLSPSSSFIKASTTGASTIGAAPSSSWAEFSSSGFGESPTTDKSSLQIGEGFDLPMPPRRITGRSPELERILGNGSRSTLSDSAPSPTTPTSAAGRAAATSAPAEIEAIEILQVDEAFYEFTQDVLLDPGIATSFPVWAMYELRSFDSHSPTSATSPPPTPPSPTWLLISIAPKPKPIPPPSAPIPTSISSSFLKPTASQRRSTSTPTSSGDEPITNKSTRRKSFLGFGMGSLGRKKSVSSGSALDGGRAGAISPSPLSLSTKNSSTEMGAKTISVPTHAASVSRTKSREIFVSSAPPVTVKKAVVGSPPPVPSSPEVVEIGRVEAEPTPSTPIVEEPTKEEVEEETEPRSEAVASEEPVEVVASPVEPEIVASAAEPEVEPSQETISTSPIEHVVEEEAPSHETPSEVVETPSSPALPPVEPTQDLADPEPSAPAPVVEEIEEQPSQEIVTPSSVETPSSPTPPPAELVEESDPTPSLPPLARPVEHEIPLVPELPTTASIIQERSTPIDEPSSNLVSPPSVVPSSRTSFETAPVAPSPLPPSTPPTLPVNNTTELTISETNKPALDLEDPETPTAPSHVEEEELEVASTEPEPKEEPKTLDEVADLVVEKVEVAAAGAVAGVVGLLQGVGLVAQEEGVEEEEVVEEKTVVEDPQPISASLEINETLETSPSAIIEPKIHDHVAEPASSLPPYSSPNTESTDLLVPTPTFLFTEHSDDLPPAPLVPTVDFVPTEEGENETRPSTHTP